MKSGSPAPESLALFCVLILFVAGDLMARQSSWRWPGLHDGVALAAVALGMAVGFAELVSRYHCRAWAILPPMARRRGRRCS